MFAAQSANSRIEVKRTLQNLLVMGRTDPDPVRISPTKILLAIRGRHHARLKAWRLHFLRSRITRSRSHL